jgi:hypothetical protein
LNTVVASSAKKCSGYLVHVFYYCIFTLISQPPSFNSDGNTQQRRDVINAAIQGNELDLKVIRKYILFNNIDTTFIPMGRVQISY